MKLTRHAVPVVLLLSAAICGAQEPPYPQTGPGGDPPSRVARLNWIQGPVSFQPAGEETWTAATPNYPLTTGDHIYTDNGARAEMHIGRNSIRLNSQTNFGFLNLDDQTVQVRFTGGVMEVRLRQLDERDLYEIDTPGGAVSLLREGEYRIDFDPEHNATAVTTFFGEAEVASGGQTFPVRARQTAWFAEGAQPDIRQQNPSDDFDRFTMDRLRAEDRLPPPAHVHPAMIGGEDLDVYGTWRQEPEYGWVWAPPVGPGWAPYRAGHWAWVEPWGWTWIDDAPWGFAPFHYGRWVMARGGWVWIPGRPVGRPVYAPALVAFVGGPRFGVGIGIGGGGVMGSVAWFPLGPQEVYRPVYAASPVYVRNVNVTNVTNVTNITNVNVTNVRYVNQSAATQVPQNVFTGGRPVAAVAAPVTPQQMANAQISHGALVAPQRESVLGASAGRVAQPPQAMAMRQVVAKSTPPPAPVAFSARQAALVQNQGRPLAAEQVQQLRQQQPAAMVNRAPVRPAMQSAAPQMQPQAPAGRPYAQPPVNRLDSRPPSAVSPGGSAAPAYSRPSPMPQSTTPAPMAPRAAPAPAPAAPQAAPTPRSAPAPAARPAEGRPGRAAERKAERKGEPHN